jgi:hypothetical protein
VPIRRGIGKGTVKVECVEQEGKKPAGKKAAARTESKTHSKSEPKPDPDAPIID